MKLYNRIEFKEENKTLQKNDRPELDIKTLADDSAQSVKH